MKRTLIGFGGVKSEDVEVCFFCVMLLSGNAA